jgi:hypothetical protein
MIRIKSFTTKVVFSMIFCFVIAWFYQVTPDAMNAVQAESPPLFISQGNSDTSNPVSSQPTTTSSQSTKAEIMQVLNVYRFSANGKEPDRHAAINDLLVIEIANFKDYYDKVLCAQKPSPCNLDPPLVLNLDGKRFTGINPDTLDFEKGKGILRFRLKGGKGNNEAWADLLRPSLDWQFSDRNVMASISLEKGSDDTPIVPSKSFKLIRYRQWHIIGWIFLLGGLMTVIKIQMKGNLTDLIRESGSKGNSQQKKRPFSLSRVQLAWWFCWVIFSYIVIYMVTGASDTLNDSTVMLLGVGSATALGAAVIDSDSTNKNKDAVPRNSEGFWKDLLTGRYQSIEESKAQGPGLHRLQLIIWTLILTVVFIVSVVTNLSMPQFSNTLLALQGIGSATYLGFKFPENSSATGSNTPAKLDDSKGLESSTSSINDSQEKK